METESTSYSREVEYPANCNSARAKKKHKETTLLSNPEQLFADFIFCNGKKIKNNVLFHTDNINMWKEIICMNKYVCTSMNILPKKALVVVAA